MAVRMTLIQKSLKWNLEQNFEDDNNKIQVQCQKNVKLIDEAFKEQLKLVSLVTTSLLTSLHDTAMEEINNGFKIASDKFERIINSRAKILKSAEKNPRNIIRGTPQYNCHRRCKNSGCTDNISAHTSHLCDQACQTAQAEE